MQLLDQRTHVFWERGFEGVSLAGGVEE